MFIEIKDIYTHLYGETIEAISGEDKESLTIALEVGVNEVKGFLSGRYDMKAAFAKKGKSRNQLLLTHIKDCAVWHYINIANPNIDFSVREKRYNNAVSFLKLAQKGDFDYDLPLKAGIDIDGDGKPDNIGIISAGSNPKREQHY